MTSNRLANVSIIRSGVAAILLKVLGALTGFAYNIILAQLLGASGTGVYYLALTMVMIGAVIGSVGLDGALLRYVATHAAKADWNNVRHLSRFGQKTVVTVSALLAVTISVMASWLAVNVFSDPQLVTPLRWMAFSIVPLAMLNLNAELLKAVNRVGSGLLFQSFAVPLVSLCLIFFLKDLQVLGAVLAHMSGCIIAMILSGLVWNRSVPKARGESSQRVGHRVLLDTSVPLMIVGIMNLVIDMTDTLMIGMMLSSADVGIYGVVLRITAVSSLILVAVNSVVARRFAALWSERRLEELNDLARGTTWAMVGLAVPMLIIFLWLAEPILSLFGDEFTDGATVLRILALSQFIALATGPVAYLLMMTGHERFHRNNVVLCAGLNIVLNLIFIPRMGIVGAAVATAISLSLKNLIALVFVRRKLKIKALI